MPPSSVLLLLLLFLAEFANCCDDYLDPPWEEEDYILQREDWSLNGGKTHEVIYREQQSEALDRRKRSFNGDEDLSCEMLIAIDSPLYAHLGSSKSNATELATDLVRRLNSIYSDTLFRGEFARLRFRIREVRVLYEFCTECNSTQRIYLQEFSRMDFSQFCLAHVFTYRDFPEGVQGLAWKGTICNGRWNTGFTTLLNHRVTASRQDSAMTLAHEIGHNLGSDHDEMMDCPSDYIMSESGSSSASPRFSPCSVRAISEVLRKVLNNPERRKSCFWPRPRTEEEDEDFSFCGDYEVQGDEECDCGPRYQTCWDPCCYAGSLSPLDLAENSSASPCRRANDRSLCLRPFHSAWKFGFVAPWVAIAAAAVLASVALVYDWHHKRWAFAHVARPKGMIRSETREQVAKRVARENGSGQERGKNVYVVHRQQQQQPHQNLPSIIRSPTTTTASTRRLRPSERPPPPPKPPPPPPAPKPSSYTSVPTSEAKDHRPPLGPPMRRAPAPPSGVDPAPVHSAFLPQNSSSSSGLVRQMRERLERSNEE